MRARGWFCGVMVLGLGTSACGHIPGYYPETDDAPESAKWAPKSPPAPPPEAAARRAADDGDTDEAYDPADDDAEAGEPSEVDEADSAPPPYTPPAPRPPRYSPPPAWEPTPEPTNRTQRPTPTPAPPARPATPEPAAPERADGVRTIRLDADTYYLVDSTRNLCFLRHKESMTAVDCARVAGTPTNESAPKAPARPAEPTPPTRDPVRPAAPERPAPPARAPTSPTPDETVRFEAAFTDIFCDRKSQDDTSPEERIRARGLSVDRYEAIESWWASDENAWFTLTGRAAKGCRR